MKKNIISSLSFWTTILLISVLCIIIKLLVTDKLDVEFITTNLIMSINDFLPETSEKIQYMLSVLMFPIIYFFSYRLYKKYPCKNSCGIFYFFILAEISICIALFPTMYVRRGYFSGYGVAFRVISPLVFICCYFLHKYILQKHIVNKTFRIIFNFLLGLFFIAFMIQIFKIQSFDPYLLPSPENFEAYFSSICKTVAGLTPGIDFRNIYGFYPYIFDIFFNSSNLSAHNLIFTFSGLTIITLLFFAVTFYLNMGNKYLALLMYLFTTTYSLMYGHIIFAWSGVFSYLPFYYYQYMPHRVIFIAIVLMMISIFPKIKNEVHKEIFKHLGFLICALALFWNLESGIAALGGWSIYHLYLKPDIKNAIKILIEAVFTIILFMIGVSITTYIHSGQIINPLELFYGQLIFYGKGFFMLKMDMFSQPWVPIVLIYFIAIADAIKGYINKNITYKNAFKIAVGFTGFAVFVYFQGRSIVWNLIVCSYPAILLLGVFMEDWFKKIQKYKKLCLKKPKQIFQFMYGTYSIKFCIIFVIVSILTTNGIICTFAHHNAKESKILQNTIPMITDDAKNYDFLTENASLLYLYFKVPNNLKLPSMPDIFYKKDVDAIIEYLKQSNKKLVIDSYTIQKFEGYKPFIIYLNNNYIVEKDGEEVVVFVKK